MCVLISLQNLPETFLILEITERNMIKNVCRASCKVPDILVWLHAKYRTFLSGFNETNFLDRFSENVSISNFMKIPLVGASKAVPCRKTDRQK